MSALNVPCPHCAQASRIDSERLPDGPASYPCPHCREKIVVDKRELLGKEALPAEVPVAPAQPATVAMPAEDGSAETSGRRFGKLPADASFPSGIILGEDEAVIAEVQKTLASLGSELERVSSVESARELILNEQPELCLYIGGTVSAPPHAPMMALAGLPPASRRRLYLALVADNLKTLDGTAAFMYQVNMTLAKADLPQLGAALYSGLDYHNRLYKPYFNAVEKV